jgi:hypothetical protein
VFSGIPLLQDALLLFIIYPIIGGVGRCATSTTGYHLASLRLAHLPPTAITPVPTAFERFLEPSGRDIRFHFVFIFLIFSVDRCNRFIDYICQWKLLPAIPPAIPPALPSAILPALPRAFPSPNGT